MYQLMLPRPFLRRYNVFVNNMDKKKDILKANKEPKLTIVGQY